MSTTSPQKRSGSRGGFRRGASSRFGRAPLSKRKPAVRHGSERAAHETSHNQRKIDSVISTALAGLGIDQDLKRYSFVTHWAEVVGASIAASTRPECIRNKTLVVRVPDSSWAQELSLRRESILARLKPHLVEGEEVEDVMFYVEGAVASPLPVLKNS